MAKYIGRRHNLGVARETTRGAGASPAYLVPKIEFSFDDRIVEARSLAGLGRIEDSEEKFVTTKYGQGDLSAEVRSKSLGLFLYATLGTLATSGPSDEAYTHAFSVANTNQHQSLSFLITDPNTTELYKLVMLESLELVQELDAVLMMNASFMGKQAVASGLSQASLQNEFKFTKKHLAVKIAANLAGLDAASAISIKSLTINISKNVALDDVIGTAEPEDILNQQLSVEGEITLNYEDETYKNYMKNATQRALEIKWVNADETIGGGSTNPSLTLRLPLVDFFDWEPNYALDEIVSQKISFKGNYDVANGNAIISTCDLVNAVTSY